MSKRNVIYRALSLVMAAAIVIPSVKINADASTSENDNKQIMQKAAVSIEEQYKDTID